jgi:DNA adenine methylase
MDKQLSIFNNIYSDVPVQKIINVASVPQRSPFRYPGGKTWLIPVIRKWLKQIDRPRYLIDSFTGGGIVGLTAAFEDLADTILMIELDKEVAAVWEVIINGDHEWLANQIYNFDLTPENANNILQKKDKNLEEQAFSTILKNRIYHGGIITKGSGIIKKGENGKGIKSRWYAKTLRDRIKAIGHVKKRIQFITGDAFDEFLKRKDEKETFFFIDPPYTVAGKRLYTHSFIDHDILFSITSGLKGKFMLTYDDTNEIRNLALKYDLDFRTIPMKTTHHIQKNEIIISDNFDWWN